MKEENFDIEKALQAVRKHKRFTPEELRRVTRRLLPREKKMLASLAAVVVTCGIALPVLFQNMSTPLSEEHPLVAQNSTVVPDSMGKTKKGIPLNEGSAIDPGNTVPHKESRHSTAPQPKMSMVRNMFVDRDTVLYSPTMEEGETNRPDAAPQIYGIWTEELLCNNTDGVCDNSVISSFIADVINT